MNELELAAEADKGLIRDKILSSEYMQNLRSMQSMSNSQFTDSNASFPEQQLNSIRKDFLINPAVPSRKQAPSNQKRLMSSGYHWHDYYEFVLVLKGRYVHFINGSSYVHEAGEICLLPPHLTHREEALEWEERSLFIGLDSRFFQSECLDLFSSSPDLYDFIARKGTKSESIFTVFKTKKMESLYGLLEFILEESREQKAGSDFLIKGGIIRLIETLMENSTYSIIEQSKEEREKNLSREIIAYIESNLATVTRESLAAYFHFNQDYLNRLLKQTTGYTYSENLREIRLRKASEMLQEGANINQVMEEIGLVNRGYFNRIFKSAFGSLPGSYKKTQ
ncbi:MAG: AraC family transcriptional regulator [Eubacteriales bacterium]|nr:AraC family transcriptional regulator [Eubacteriales bacterium]